jgi:serine protease AprX
MIKRLLFCLLAMQPLVCAAQDNWWVYFTDKKACTFNPYTYFAPEAIARRINQGLPVCDSSDFPVSENYLAQVQSRVLQTGYASRWFNAVSVQATADQVATLRRLPFVRAVEPQSNWSWTAAATDTISEWPFKQVKPSDHLQPLQAQYFARGGYKAKGIVIAVLDVGFHGADKHEAFRHLYFNNRVKATFDFVENDWDVYDNREDHGTMVLSCLAGQFGNYQLGMATEATYLLARISRDFGNQYRGEERWVAAMEWADQQGANIINTSGGPNEEAYFREQIDGKTAIITRAGNVAARKGILVVAAAGNNGEFERGFLLPPSDADSVLTVAATDNNGLHAGYSATGPTWDFRRKPDLCAPGDAPVANGKGKYSMVEGTSFSCPIVAGMAACFMQKYPSVPVMGVADSLRKSCNRYPYYDYMHGYGVPQASCFFGVEKAPVQPCFTFEQTGDSLIVKLNANVVPAFGGTAAMLFYNLEDAKGRIYEYHVIRPGSATPVIIHGTLRSAGGKINVYYEGYYASHAF